MDMTGYFGINQIKNKKEFYIKNRFYGFKNITEERRDEILQKAFIWLAKNTMEGENKLNRLYFILNDNDYLSKLGIKSNDEAFLFLLFAFDHDLKLLQIYYEESITNEIARRFKEEFGAIYDARLLQIEMYYNRKFPTIVDEFDLKH